MSHIAETREQAKREVAKGLPAYAYYAGAVSERTFEWHDASDDRRVASSHPAVEELIDAFGGTQICCIGTPEDAIEMIRGIVETTGGFGKLLLLVGNDWASQEATNRSLELFAREVMPVFQGSSIAPIAAEQRAQDTRDLRVAAQRASIDAARESYDAKVADPQAG